MTASSGDGFALVSGTNKVNYKLAESGDANTTIDTATEKTSWEFTALTSEATTQPMGIIVEDYSSKPAGTYQDTVTFTAKVESASTPVTAITLNKTATTIQAGNKETLSVSTVTPDNATDQTVTWSSDNEEVATVNATTGEVTAVAAGISDITATANDGSGVTATCAVTVIPATITVTWNNNDITGGGFDSFTKDGVTITADMIEYTDKNFMDGTFTTTLGNFTKIEVTTSFWDASGTGWSGSTWTGNASSVSFSGNIMGQGRGNTKFVFTIEPTN